MLSDVILRLRALFRRSAIESYRDALGVRLVHDVWRDVRLALRALRATPVVTSVAVLSLAPGIGANTAIFSLVNSLLLHNLPVVEPERLVLLSSPTAISQGRAAGWTYRDVHGDHHARHRRTFEPCRRSEPHASGRSTR